MSKKQEYDTDIYNINKRFSEFEEYFDREDKPGYDMLPENKKLAKEFKRKAYASSLMGKHRLMKYRTFFRNFDKILKKPFDQVERKDLEEVITEIKSRIDWKQSTKADFLKMLKRYYKILYDMEDQDRHPEIVDWIKIDKPKLPPINYEDVPKWDDILEMARQTLNTRDRALIKSLWESGNRIGEHLTLLIKDVEEGENGVYLNIRESKTEPRKVFIRLSAEDVTEWRENHPLKHENKAPLFPTFKDPGKALSHQYAYKMMKRLKRDAGVDKKIYPHMLRHGSASYFCDWLSDSDMDSKYGWTGNTRNRYQHKNTRSVESKIMKMSGDEDSNHVKNIYEDRENNKKTCFHCKQENNIDRIRCWNCRRSLDLDVIDKVERVKQNLDQIHATQLEEHPEALKVVLDLWSDKSLKKLGLE